MDKKLRFAVEIVLEEALERMRQLSYRTAPGVFWNEDWVLVQTTLPEVLEALRATPQAVPVSEFSVGLLLNEFALKVRASSDVNEIRSIIDQAELLLTTNPVTPTPETVELVDNIHPIPPQDFHHIAVPFPGNHAPRTVEIVSTVRDALRGIGGEEIVFEGRRVIAISPEAVEACEKALAELGEWRSVEHTHHH